MNLAEGKNGSFYQVEHIEASKAVLGRLEALGIRRGAVIEVIGHKKNGSAIIYIRKTRVALGRQITFSMTVNEVKR